MLQDNFAHICWAIKAKESQNSWDDILARMKSAENPEESLKILNDTYFSDWFEKNLTAKDFEKILEKSLLSTKDFLTKRSPEKWIINLLWASFDYFNLKIFLKAKLKWLEFQNIEQHFSVFWNIKLKEIKDVVYEWHFFKIERLNTLIRKINKEYERTKDIRVVDFLADNDLYSFLLEKSQKIWAVLVYRLHRRKIDILNILTYLRTYKDGFNSYFFIKWWSLDMKVLENWDKNEINNMIKGKICNFWKDYDIFENKSFLEMEFQLEKRLNYFIWKINLQAYWRELVFAHFYKKFQMAKNIRRILVWKLNKIKNV